MQNDFLHQLTNVVKENISDEMFGVSELASELGMSRSNLLRKIKKLTNVSASQFIRQVRLREAMDLLKQSSLTVSEVSFKVGFSSTSYFIKCFREEYGYPPGEVGKRNSGGIDYQNVKTQTHELAAIMFTDIEGYTKLMQQNEEKAISFRNRHREVFNSITEKHNGKILQYYGDGTLSTFHSAIDAVRCGVEMQQAFGEEPKIPVRIGIHTGDILFSEDGIVGDGVNVASRIESLASAQSVFISEKVYDEVKNQSGIQTESMGIFELKNVDKPMEVFAISNEGLAVPDKTRISGKVKMKSPTIREDTVVSWRKVAIVWIFLPLMVALLGYFLLTTDILKGTSDPGYSTKLVDGKKSIAVLPFRNDSNDSSNVYFINGLMESTLNNLQKIKDLRVISRTSVEKYRNSPKTSPEIARELNVQYLIEGSGQKIGDQILLHIQLIEAVSDQHLWGEQYDREANNIFGLQREIAENIIEQIQVILTPEEKERINKVPTDNLVAYDFFLKGFDLLNKTRESQKLKQAIEYFKKAIEHDSEFARAHAAIAISYYYLDLGRSEKKYADSINHYADQALLFDDKLPQSLIAKGLFYMQNREYQFAESYFEKVLEYNPNNDLVYIFLIELYRNYMPNTEKYLKYALKGIDIDVAAYDSITASFSYLHISNAFIQSGFVEEADYYIRKSLDYYPENQYAKHIQAFVDYAQSGDLEKMRNDLKEVLRMDSTNLEVLRDNGTANYYLRDYEKAYVYYNKINEIREAYNLNMFVGENAKIALVLSKLGIRDKSEKYIKGYRNYAENDKTIYKYLSLAAYYSFMNEKEKSD
jgi:TolB-like protein/class 3 adenylate cyclase/Tfp pilus assembly protein PilF